MEKIMDKISKKAVDTYHSAAKATENFAKEIKLKNSMSENKAKIQELYEDIGKTVYEKYVLKQEINVDRDLMNNCSMIDILADEVDDIRMELLKLKNLKQCPQCHYEIYNDFHYCPNCGYIQEQNEEKKQNDGPATIVTTDLEDSNLKQHIDSFPSEAVETIEENYNTVADSEIDEDEESQLF